MMDSVKAGSSCHEAAGGRVRCGLCPSCIFDPSPPDHARGSRTASDEFKRKFVLELLLRCRDVPALESIQAALEVTTWTLFAYSRSRRPVFPEEYPSRGSHGRQDGGPRGLDVSGIRRWFDGSPHWLKSSYILSLCDAELLRTVYNLASTLLVRHRRGFLRVNASETNEDSEDSEDPALMVVPGASKSLSGVSRYKDFIGCLPVDLAKRILGLLEEHTLKRCKKVSSYWRHLAQETMEEIKFRRKLQDQMKDMMKRCSSIHRVSPTYANFVDVLVPLKEEEEDGTSAGHTVRTFEAAYANIKTKPVKMEERNVYCCVYFTKVLLEKEDPWRVLDFRGGALMAMGSKDRVVHLFHVGLDAQHVAVLKGHLGSVRAVLLCEDRGLLITGGCDASIRCWSLKTDRCETVFYGHTGTVSCLDVHAGRLVSGAKDRSVKVWCLNTRKRLAGLFFKHPSWVRCVRIRGTTVYSSCDQGLVKIWSVEHAALLRVIGAHGSPVKCLFCDDWHLLSGDTNGRVMAWSTNCAAIDCLMTFDHPMEVRSLTLMYLRVITSCVNGKIRIFNFLTGDRLEEITAETEAGGLLSLHVHDDRMLVNSTHGVKLYQFAKVFWDYADSDAQGQTPAALLGAGDAAQRPLVHSTKTRRAQLLSRSGSVCLQAKERCESAEPSVAVSEKAARERMRKRGPHHPPTRDAILLRLNAIQKARCTDQASINMENNARLRDSWGPPDRLQDPPQLTQDPPGADPWRAVPPQLGYSWKYLALPQERKQEMLAIAGLLCTRWEIMGTVRRDGDVLRGMFHTGTSTLSGQEAAVPVSARPPCPSQSEPELLFAVMMMISRTIMNQYKRLHPDPICSQSCQTAVIHH
ncbi:CMT1A duplicated region transcript 1 protein [Parambassis ranga]|uniref:CMT1A duplicated region transcript 1 protein n=1 Tax=Parambassis ranga TaxID=210632 RepID=A0A6P7IN37_9TELE|nr:CMT1A duplicated region transcript 1 protein [Parambassis ranga]